MFLLCKQYVLSQVNIAKLHPIGKQDNDRNWFVGD